MVLIPLFWTKAGIRGMTAMVALAAVKAVAIALLWTGTAIWRAMFERSVRVKIRDVILACRWFFWKVRNTGKETDGFFCSAKVGKAKTSR